MSEVGNIILTMSWSDFDDCETLPAINEFFKKRKTGFSQTNIRENFDGDKFFEAAIYIGAFNGIDIVAFIKHLKKLVWLDRDCVQVFYKGQQDEVFSVFTLGPQPFPKIIGKVKRAK